MWQCRTFDQPLYLPLRHVVSALTRQWKTNSVFSSFLTFSCVTFAAFLHTRFPVFPVMCWRLGDLLEVHSGFLSYFCRYGVFCVPRECLVVCMRCFCVSWKVPMSVVKGYGTLSDVYSSFLSYFCRYGIFGVPRKCLVVCVRCSCVSSKVPMSVFKGYGEGSCILHNCVLFQFDLKIKRGRSLYYALEIKSCGGVGSAHIKASIPFLVALYL